jgi:hypothetical protein
MSRAHRKGNEDETAAEIDTDLKWLEEMAARGSVRKGPTAGQPLPDWFFTRELPVAKKSVLEQLLKDRHSDD